MKMLIHNPRVTWTIRVALIVCGVALVAGVGFFQGMFYANRKATVRMANDGCFFSLRALRAAKEPERDKSLTLYDWEMDASGLKLAEMSLKHPRHIERAHYNLLRKVRAYREQHGRGAERHPYINPAEVDKRIADAIAYLESIHDTNEWGSYKLSVDKDGDLTIQQNR